MDDIKKLVGSIKKISSLPAIFIKVNELIEDPTSCAADLGRVIEKDQALTSTLLRLANSAFYKTSKRALNNPLSARSQTAVRRQTLVRYHNQHQEYEEQQEAFQIKRLQQTFSC